MSTGILDDGEWLGLLPLKPQRIEHYSVLASVARGFFEQVTPSPNKKSGIKASPKQKGDRKNPTTASAKKANQQTNEGTRKRRTTTPAIPPHSPPTTNKKSTAVQDRTEESEATSPLSSTKQQPDTGNDSVMLVPAPHLLPALQTSFMSETGKVTLCCLNPGEFFSTPTERHHGSATKAQICLWNSEASRCIWRFFLEPHTAVTHLVLLQNETGKAQIVVVIACRLLPGNAIDTKSNALLWLVDASTGVVLLNSLRLSGGPVGEIVVPTKGFGTTDQKVDCLVGAVTLQGKLHIINPSRYPVYLSSCHAPALHQWVDLKDELSVVVPEESQRSEELVLEHVRLFVTGDRLRCIVTFSDGRMFCLHDGIWRSIDFLKYALSSDFYEVPCGENAKLALLLAESVSLNRRYRVKAEATDILCEILMCEEVEQDRTIEHCMEMIFAAAYLVSPTEFMDWLENLITRLVEMKHFDLLYDIVKGFVSDKPPDDGLFPWHSEALLKPLLSEISREAIICRIETAVDRVQVSQDEILIKAKQLLNERKTDSCCGAPRTEMCDEELKLF